MFNIDRKTFYIIIGAIVLFNVILGGRSIESLILSLPGVIVAMTFHEFAHAWVATKLGDDTPRLQGRLNLNPMSHIDPVGLISLMLLGFGWGRPVQINTRNINSKYSLSKAEALVAVAGPVMNIIIAFIALLASAILLITIDVFTKPIQILITILQSITIVNLGLGVFNLIPIYPLDGSKVIGHFLSYRAREWMIQNQFLLTIILFLVVFSTNIIGYIVQYLYQGMLMLVELLIGVFI